MPRYAIDWGTEANPQELRFKQPIPHHWKHHDPARVYDHGRVVLRSSGRGDPTLRQSIETSFDGRIRLLNMSGLKGLRFTTPDGGRVTRAQLLPNDGLMLIPELGRAYRAPAYYNYIEWQGVAPTPTVSKPVGLFIRDVEREQQFLEQYKEVFDLAVVLATMHPQTVAGYYGVRWLDKWILSPTNIADYSAIPDKGGVSKHPEYAAGLYLLGKWFLDRAGHRYTERKFFEKCRKRVEVPYVNYQEVSK